MHTLLVHVHVVPEAVAAFLEASRENADQSRREPGVARFDVLRHRDDDSRFVLVEVYRTAEAVAAHKTTAHYAKWRDTVAAFMAEPRVGVPCVNVSPPDDLW
jgi:quinol monooxygenase YgiN